MILFVDSRGGPSQQEQVEGARWDFTPEVLTESNAFYFLGPLGGKGQRKCACEVLLKIWNQFAVSMNKWLCAKHIAGFIM